MVKAKVLSRPWLTLMAAPVKSAGAAVELSEGR